jgi:uncharacterized membrane protein
MAHDSATPPPHHFLHLEPTARCIVAALIAVATFFVARRFAVAPTSLIGAWDSFALVLLALIWTDIFSSGVDHIRYRARTQDLGRALIFTFTVAAACSSLFAVVFLLSAAKNTSHLGLHATLSVVAVLSSWTLVHTMFSIRYAHAYYGDGKKGDANAGGLDFPSDKNPNYLDFAYFSFVIGMTCQVSDVQITSKYLRSVALVHGILAFCFNTVILALTINTISGLL